MVGFAAETKNIIENAQKKIQNKHCDWILANNVADKSIGFNSDYNEVFLIGIWFVAKGVRTYLK